MTILSTGSIISYSTGTTYLSPWRFRVVKDVDWVGHVLRAFPELGPLLQGVPPMIINGYPASLGVFSSGVFLDTYLRAINLARGISLATELHAPVVFLAQPLVAASMLLQANKLVRWGLRHLILAVGGYNCPSSLEAFLIACGNRLSDKTIVVHAYGVAEADYACLVGIARNSSNHVIYKHVTSDFAIDIGHGVLRLIHNRSGSVIETDDFAEYVDGGVVIRNSGQRLHSEILRDLSSWTHDQWNRRTGYLHFTSSGVTYQLREHQSPRSNDEMDHYDFCRSYGMSFAEKPKWIIQDR